MSAALTKSRLRSIIKHSDYHKHSEQRRREIVSRNARTFLAVLQCYAELRATSPIGAVSIDPQSKRNGLSPAHVEFCSDVDLCVRRALKTDDQRKFYVLVSIEIEILSNEAKIGAKNKAGVSPQIESRLAQVLGAQFVKRGLDPGRYFQQIKRRKIGEQPRQCSVRIVPREQAPDSEAAELSGYGFGIVDNREAA